MEGCSQKENGIPKEPLTRCESVAGDTGPEPVTPAMVRQYSSLLRQSSTSCGGRVVFEPFGGSGTTLIAAERSNRTAYVIEMRPEYCDRIIERWETLTGNKARRESG